jgi:hypothetical protein
MSRLIDDPILLFLMRRIEDNAAAIYVRAEVNGGWGFSSLAELPGDVAIRHAFRFLREEPAGEKEP